jgi:hypothetical protein
MQSTFKIEKDYRVIKRWLMFFMIMLFISGVTAIPAEWELSMATKFLDRDSFIGAWLNEVYGGIRETGKNYPYLFYGYDWLAFAHIVLAILFIGPYRDPVKNKWVIEFGMIACLLIIPFALIAGHFRGIPFWWRLGDCSFGIIGLLPLVIAYRKTCGLDETTYDVDDRFAEFERLVTDQKTVL